MADLNVWSGTGRLGRDAEFKTLDSGKQLLTFDIAVDTGWGEYKKTIWIRVKQWGDRGKKIAGYLKKGKYVAVTGTLGLDEWTDKSTGAKRQQVTVDVTSVQFISSGGDAPSMASDKVSKIAADGSEIEDFPF